MRKVMWGDTFSEFKVVSLQSIVHLALTQIPSSKLHCSLQPRSPMHKHPNRTGSMISLTCFHHNQVLEDRDGPAMLSKIGDAPSLYFGMLHYLIGHLSALACLCVAPHRNHPVPHQLLQQPPQSARSQLQ